MYELQLESNKEKRDLFKVALKKHTEDIEILQKKYLIMTSKKSTEPTTNDSMLQQTENIQQKTSNKLQKIKIRANETLEIGKEIANDLENQTEQIIRVDDGLTNIQSEVKIVSNRLKTISKRIATDKFFICFALVLFCLVIAVIVVVVVV